MALLLVKHHCSSVAPKGACTPAVHPFATEQDRDAHLRDESRVLGLKR